MIHLIKTVEKAKPSSQDEEIVRNCLFSNLELKSMQNTFLKIIATLENDFLKEEVCKSAISLLKSRINYENDMERVREFVADKSSIPRNLRLKVKLTGRASIVRSQEFLALEESVKSADIVWQRQYKNAFRHIREMERNDSGNQHADNFFKVLDKLTKMKAIFEIKKLIPSKQKNFKKGFKSLTAAAWVSIFIEMDSSFSTNKNNGISKTIDLSIEDDSTILPSNITTTKPPSSVNSEPLPNENSIARAIEAEANIETTSTSTPSSTSNTSSSTSKTTTPSEDNPTENSTNISNQTDKNNANIINLVPVTPKPITTKRTKTSQSYYDWLSALSLYINVSTEKIREKIFSTLNEEEGLELLVLADKDHEKLSIILRLHTFIASCIPLITSYSAEFYNSNRREREAAAEAMAAVSSTEIEQTTQSIANIVDSEDTMSCKYMKDFVSKDVTKKVNKVLSKNFKGGKKVVFADAPQPNRRNSPHQQQFNMRQNTPPPSRPNQNRRNNTKSPRFNNQWRRTDHQHSPPPSHPHSHHHQQQRQRTQNHQRKVSTANPTSKPNHTHHHRSHSTHHSPSLPIPTCQPLQSPIPPKSHPRFQPNPNLNQQQHNKRDNNKRINNNTQVNQRKRKQQMERGRDRRDE